MKVTTVHVTYGETRSVNYQSCKIEIGLTAQLDENDEKDVDYVQQVLEKRCVQIVNEAFLRHNTRKAGE